MKTFKKFLESCKAINEAEYNAEWWDSKSDSFKKRYIERHPNSIYAQKGMGGKDISYDEFKNRNKLSKDEKKAAWDREQKKHNDNLSKIKKKSNNNNTLKIKKIDMDDALRRDWKIYNTDKPPRSMTPEDYDILMKSVGGKSRISPDENKKRIQELFAKSRNATPEFLHNYIKKDVDTLLNSDWKPFDKLDTHEGYNFTKALDRIAIAYNNPNISDEDKNKIEEVIKKSKKSGIKETYVGSIVKNDLLTDKIEAAKDKIADKPSTKSLYNKDNLPGKKPEITPEIKKRGDRFTKLLHPKKYWVGQIVDPDEAPDGVLVDNDGEVIGFDSNNAAKKYSTNPTEQDKKANKELEKWLGSDEYDIYMGN